MSFNRLKAPDYRAALEAAGFKILHFEVNPPTETDYQQLDQVTAHSCFAHLTRQELVAKHLFFVAARP
jgi:hypothetical protein